MQLVEFLFDFSVVAAACTLDLEFRHVVSTWKCQKRPVRQHTAWQRWKEMPQRQQSCVFPSVTQHVHLSCRLVYYLHHTPHSHRPFLKTCTDHFNLLTYLWSLIYLFMVCITTEAVGADCFRSYNGPAVVQLHPSFLES